MFRAKQRRQDKAQSGEWRVLFKDCNAVLAPLLSSLRAGREAVARGVAPLARARHYLHGAPGAQPLPDPLNMTISPGKSTRERGQMAGKRYTNFLISAANFASHSLDTGGYI